MEISPTFTILIALITLVFAIFGASWLNQRATERMLESLKGELKAEIESLKNEMRSELKRLDQRLDSIDGRLSRVERQLESIFKPVLPK